MIEFWTQPWFGWAVAVVVGLPVLLIVLTELGGWLQRRSSPAAKPVFFLRNFVIPVGVLLALLSLAGNTAVEVTWVRVVATVFGFLVILLLLSGVNVVIFGSPKAGSWRDRLPSIFIDLARLALILVGLAVLFSWVWNADVGGLFAALGVTSIVIGLALQNAVGSVISGLLLLFEQPFRLGDWLDTSEGRGRVIEVNWRAVHLEVPEGTLVIPTAQLADGAFTNLSRGAGPHVAGVEVSFATDDAPHEVSATLLRVAGDLPMVDLSRPVGVAITGPGTYSVEIPVPTPADDDGARSLFLAWLWYAAARHGLHWSGGPAAEFATDSRVAEALVVVSRALRLSSAELEPHAAALRFERYATGETLQRTGEVPAGLSFVVEGRVALLAERPGGARVPVETLDRGSYVGQTALTREPVAATATALSPVTVAYLPRETVDELVRVKPSLGTYIGAAIDARRVRVSEAIAGAAALQERASTPES